MPISEIKNKINDITNEIEKLNKNYNKLENKIHSENILDIEKTSIKIGNSTLVSSVLDVPN